MIINLFCHSLERIQVKMTKKEEKEGKEKKKDKKCEKEEGKVPDRRKKK